jgi:hypothetical protein
MAGSASADRAVTDALNRIRTTVRAGVPSLESRIDDAQLGSIRVLVSGRPGEAIHAELVARDPAAAQELTQALHRALASGATLPAGVDLSIRTDAPTRPSAGGHPGHEPGHQQPAGDGTTPGDRRGDQGPAFTFGREPGEPRPEVDPSRGRERRPGPAPVAPATVTRAARSGAGLDVRA